MNRIRKITLLALVAALALPALAATASPPTPCYDVTITYLGRDFVRAQGDTLYYKWKYRVTGGDCINRGNSHWVLELCGDYLNSVDISEISTMSVDHSDPTGSDTTYYDVTLGPDPTTGVTGIKWDYAGGNQLDKTGEYDDFCFVSTGHEEPGIIWASKAGTIVVNGTTTGPDCKPVPTVPMTWSAIKAAHDR